MIYLDHQATTPVAPEALQAMLPLFGEHFANAGSVTHQAGLAVRQQVDEALGRIAYALGAEAEEIVITSGATESNNLALFGFCLHPRQKRRKIVSVRTEHKALLDPLARLEKLGFQVEYVRIETDQPNAGLIDLEHAAELIDSDTALVSVMLANNEIGVVQPLAKIAALCRQSGAVLHSDATQALGKVPVDVDSLDVDMMSFSAHKFYGPKGVGGLYVRRRDRRLRLQPQIVGGGQQHNLRSGTLNSVGIVGMAAALTSCINSMAADQEHVRHLRNQLFTSLHGELDFIGLNGPAIDVAPERELRLAGNLNCCFYPIEGQSLMLACPELAVSSGSACTSAEPAPSHVLLNLGLSEDQARSSLRFGIGRTNTAEEIEKAVAWLVEGAQSLRKFL